MNTYQFKTNIKCGGCVAQLKPLLDAQTAIDTWQVDTQSPDKILTVSTSQLSPTQIQELVEKAGFKAQLAEGKA
jgi:copper chaperone